MQWGVCKREVNVSKSQGKLIFSSLVGGVGRSDVTDNISSCFFFCILNRAFYVCVFVYANILF